MIDIVSTTNVACVSLWMLKFSRLALAQWSMQNLDDVVICFTGIHLSIILEEQRSPTQNQNGGRQESISFSFGEQYPKTSQAVR